MWFVVGTAGQWHEFTDIWGCGVKLRRRISTCFHLQRGRRRHEVPLSLYTKVQGMSFSKAKISMYYIVIGDISGYDFGAHFTDCTLDVTI